MVMNPVVVMNTLGNARPMGMQVTATCDEEEDWTLSRASADPLVAVYPVLVMNTIMVMNPLMVMTPLLVMNPLVDVRPMVAVNGYKPIGGFAPYGGYVRDVHRRREHVDRLR